VGSHHDLVRSFFGDVARGEALSVDADVMLGELSQVIGTSKRNVLISSEMLPGRADIGRLISAITSRMGAGPVAVEILVVCREHFARAASAYNQRVKDVVRWERSAPDEFLRRHCAEVSYKNLIQALRRTGHGVTALNYHPATGLVERFLRHVGFPADRIPSPEMRNVSLSPKGLIATLAANNVAASAFDRERYFEALRRMRPFFSPSVFIFGPRAAREANQKFEPDRQFLYEEFGIELPRRDDLERGSQLYLDERDLTDIRAATAELGAEGEAIAKFASTFQRL